MKKAISIIEFTLMAILTIALYFHFFQAVNIPIWITYIFWSSIFLLIVGSIMGRKIKVTNKEKSTFTLYLGIYLLSQLIIFTLAGGKPSSIVSLSNPVL